MISSSSSSSSCLPRKSLGEWTAWIIVTLAVWCGLFFGLIEPDIYHASFKPAQCTVLSAEIAARYSCSKTCSSCTQSFAYQSCGAVISELEQLSPAACANGTASQCPPAAGVSCGNGYTWCAQACNTCCSVCSGDDILETSEEGGSTSTRPKSTCTPVCTPCYCACVYSVQDLDCTVTCAQVFDAILHVEYAAPVVNETASITQYFGADKASAEAFLQQHAGEFTCFYAAENSTTVELSHDYNAQDWVWFAVFGCVPLLVVLFVGTAQLLGSWSASVAVWFGVLIPLCVFVPIASVGAVTEQQQMALGATACVMAAIAPAKWVDETFPKRGFLYITAVLIPVGVGVPIYQYKDQNQGKIIFLVSYLLTILMGFGIWAESSTREFRDRFMPAPPLVPPPASCELQPERNNNNNNGDAEEVVLT